MADSDNPKTPVDFGFESVSATEKTRKVRGVFDSVASRYDVMNDLMSFAMHRIWKRLAVMSARVREGDRVLDLAGGTGDLTRLFAPLLGASGQVVLSDINWEMLSIGRDRLLDAGHIANVAVAQINAEQLPFEAHSFDVVNIAFGLRNVTAKQAALAEMFRVLRPGGRALVLEFSELKLKALRPAYDTFSFKILPTLGRVVADDADSYRYLAESIRKHPNQASLLDMMREAGFERCRYRNMAGGIVALHEGMRL